ncbi:MAG: tRNA (adenosine(37)-N6)-threonylcarbamoyltransferase complex ATPase subunit type 1 TsaE [Smithellaceae bacterium]|nr:tRNA (adenosine(37)-N6)-threonylcarbamoyltransferase complex ATPase subunit type 1 TsaE [Smithellaceae bacterium]
MKENSVIKIISASPEITTWLGSIIGGCLNRGAVVALQGELGAGKTWLTKGIAQGIGIDREYEITSPTFVLINEYPGAIPLFHMDAYRLRGTEDLQELGFEGIHDSTGVWVIEWAEKIGPALPDFTITIQMAYQDENNRELIISGEAGKLAEIRSALVREGFSEWR